MKLRQFFAGFSITLIMGFLVAVPSLQPAQAYVTTTPSQVAVNQAATEAVRSATHQNEQNSPYAPTRSLVPPARPSRLAPWHSPVPHHRPNDSRLRELIRAAVKAAYCGS